MTEYHDTEERKMMSTDRNPDRAGRPVHEVLSYVGYFALALAFVGAVTAPVLMNVKAKVVDPARDWTNASVHCQQLTFDAERHRCRINAAMAVTGQPQLAQQ